ncbi:MAG: prepilin-type N-terminal cleavage/methylation domain-containing protein, partial [Mahellales bacterium]
MKNSKGLTLIELVIVL